MSRKFLRQQQKKSKTPPQVQQLFATALGFHQKGNLQQAERLYRQLLQNAPEHTDSLYNMGVIFQKTGRIREAIGTYQRILHIDPKYADTYINLGLLLEKDGRYKEALGIYQRACEIKQHYVSYYNLAGPLYHLKQYKECEKALREAIRLKPDFAQSHMNLATVLKDLKKYDEAEKECIRAVELAPDMADAYFNMGKIYEAQEKFECSITEYRKTLKVDPKHDKAQACLYQRLLRSCAWDELKQLEPEIDALTDELMAKGRCPGITNFTQIARCDDLARNLEIATAWSEDIKRKVAREKPEFSFAGRTKDKDKITIGFLSADFRAHAFAYISKYLFETMDKDRFKIIAYATAVDDSDVREYYKKTADEFVEVHKMSDVDAAKRIYDDGVDILCECTGYTAGSRIEIAAMRPAPVQVNFWGFVGTTGADFLDYIIVDDVVVPKQHQPYYGEKLATLPNSLQINHKNEEISDHKFTRRDFSLPENGFVFCSLNQSYKIEPVIFDVWMELLKEVENSVLWVRKPEEMAVDNLWKEAEKRGVEKSRIIFAEKLRDREEYFKRIQLADIGLDTRLYNGGSTTMDALWAGVPVITLLGNHYASRMSAGIINGACMPELITHSLQEYKDLALKFANNSEELRKVKEKLWQQREVCPLFDTERFVRNLERAYEQMWKKYAVGEQPSGFEVTE